jgi:hypothetical protein
MRPLASTVCCAVALVAAGVQAAQTPGTTPLERIARVNGALDAAAIIRPADADDSSKQSARFRPAWDLLDALIVDQLNAGASRSQVAMVVGKLHEHRDLPERVVVLGPRGEVQERQALPPVERHGPFLSSDDMVRLSGKAELPSYYFADLDSVEQPILIARYTNGRRFGSSSHLSLLSRSGGHWARMAAIDVDEILEIFTFPGLPVPRAVITTESVSHADGFGHILQRWDVSNLRLVKLGLPTVELGEDEISLENDALVITHSIFPSCLGTNVADSYSNRYKMTLRLAGGTITSDTRSLTPWIDTADRLCSATKRHDLEAIPQISSRPGLYESLGGGPFLVETIAGDLVRGEGFVSGRTDRGTFRIVSRLHPSGQWMVDEIIRVR